MMALFCASHRLLFKENMENQEILRGFAPITGEKDRVLILGSMPSVQSLQRQEYYGHPRNHFWPILFTLLGEIPTADYEKKTELLRRHGIALWDSIGACRRQGSLDQAIRDVEPNPIEDFLRAHPAIRLVCFNGQMAQKCHDRFWPRLPEVTYLLLPSTSPVPRRTIRTMADKLPAWQTILPYLTKETD